MRRSYLAAGLVGAVGAGLYGLVQFGGLAQRVAAAAEAGAVVVDERGLWLRDWLGPTPLVPLVALAIGLLVGLWIAAAPGAKHQAGTRAGAAAGLGALLALLLVCTAVATWLGANPALQELVQLSEPVPTARLAPAAIAWLGAGLGAILGLFVGAQSFAAALVGGLVADLLRGRSRRQAHHPVG